MAGHEQLKLENQLCFPIYAASRLVTRLYTPLLQTLDITYPQYLVLLVLWEHGTCSVSKISSRIHLESNTLTPLLKRLEQKKIVIRSRSKEDERVVKISLTAKGKKMEKKACSIPEKLINSTGEGFSPELASRLKDDLHKLIDVLS